MFYFDLTPAFQPNPSGVQRIIWEVANQLISLKDKRIRLFGFAPRALSIETCPPPHLVHVVQHIQVFSFPRKVFDRVLPTVVTHVPLDIFLPLMTYYFSFDWQHALTRTKSGAMVFDLTPLQFPQWHTDANRVALTDRLVQISRRASDIVAISNQTKNDLIEHYPHLENKITVAYPGLTTARYTTKQLRQKSIIQLPRRYFLYVGTLEPRKNLLRLLEAYELLPTRLRKKWPLVIAGSIGWKSKAVEKRMSMPGLVYLGYLTGTDLAKCYDKAYALLFPSLYEGFGLPIVEAMDAGKVVLTSNIGSMLEAGGNAGLYCDPYSVSSIVKGLETIIGLSSKEYSLLAEKGKKQAQRFSYPKMTDAILRGIGFG